MTQFDHLINGERRAGSSYSPNVNPSNLADVLGEYTQGDAAQVDAAVAAATAAFPAWSSSHGPREQGRYAQEFFTTVKTAYTLA